MHSNITHLKPMVVGEDTAEAELDLINRSANEWELVRTRATPELLRLAQTIYYVVLDYYIRTLRAMPMTYVARTYNRSLSTAFSRADIPAMRMGEFLQGLEVSRSVPLITSFTKRGGMMLLPRIATQTHISRDLRGEAVCDLNALLEGREDGPVLSAIGKQMANAPFDPLPSEAPPSDEIRPSVEKFDTPAKPAEPVRFGASLPDQVTESHTSSTVRLETE